MKQLLLKSLVIAIVFGIAVGFLDSFVRMRNIHKYDPPISTLEAQTYPVSQQLKCRQV